MQTKTLYLFTRTPLHVGAGSSVGAIDQPVAREKHTGIPIIPGSAIKGVLADQYVKDRSSGTRTDAGRDIFGHERPDDAESKSGGVSFCEGRLLAFPVRSAKGCFAWVTSPLLLERWKNATGESVALPQNLPTAMEIYGDADTLAHDHTIVLEDYAFDHKGAFSPGEGLKTSGGVPLWSDLSPSHLCLISDDMLSHFARNSCEVAQHVRINDETGAADEGALFNQENVPAETLFFSALVELRSGALAQLTIPPVLQVGGDATTGLGFCSANLTP